MATSGTYLWNPELADMVDEAFERCWVDPATLVHRHVMSARRSINYMLADWAARSFSDFRIERVELALVEDQQQYPLSGVDDFYALDILNIVLRRNGVDTPLLQMSRSEWLEIPTKTYKGRPDRYFVDKQRDFLLLEIWPIAENSTDVLVYDRVRRYQDADRAAQNPDIPYYLREAFVSGLAARLATKGYTPPEREAGLMMMAEDALRRGMGASMGNEDVRIRPGSGRRSHVSRGRIG
jgi:hypothetical protein